MTVGERAEELGLKSWDGALPQGWFDRCFDATGQNPSGHIVWCYDDTPEGITFLGYPVALSAEGEAMLETMDSLGY